MINHFKFYFVISVLFIINLCVGQETSNQRLKVVNSGQSLWASPWTYSATERESGNGEPMASGNIRNTGEIFPRGSAICAYGMWALYNNTNWGELLERSTHVVSVRGLVGSGSCAQMNVNSAFRNVKSIKYLGNPNPDQAGLDIYSQSNFLGVSFYTGQLPGPGQIVSISPGIPLGSLAITGRGRWRLCGDRECTNVTCVDTFLQRSGLYMNRNVQEDKTTNWPIYVRAYSEATEDQCNMDGGPPTPIVTSKRSLSRARKPLEVVE